MTLGDGIRRNIAHVEPGERIALRDAILELHNRYYPGARGDTPPGGVSWWFKQDEIHQATHVHGGPEFLPWHREITNRFEELLRQVNPQLSLHYWDFTEDPTSIPNGNLGGGTTGSLNLFDSTFMGSSNGSAGDPWLTGKFYDPQAGQSGHPPNRNVTGNPVDPPTGILRTKTATAPLMPITIGGPGGFGIICPNMTISNDGDFTSALTYPEFRIRLECVHNRAHVYIANVSPHDAFRDPLVFLLHSNIDRIFARWQTDPLHQDRLDPALVYGTESNLDISVPDGLGGTETQNLTHLVEPWSTGVGAFHSIRPWEATHENQGVPHTYHDVSVVAPPCYDTNLSSFRVDEVENPLNAGTGRYQVIFNDVPEEETTWRAAMIRIFTCDDTTFRIKPGTEPAAPFGIAVGQATASHGVHPRTFQDVRLWLQYTAGALGTAPHVDGPVNTTVRCDQTGQEFQFELRANTIHRPTVAVQMVLDQSGSMAWPAGTSGLVRLDVLKDAAKLFATVIQDNNGLGIVRFDQDAYPPNDPTYGGLPITRILAQPDRDAARNAIDAHGAHGATSVGDGLVMGHNQLIALPAGSYDNTALLLLTDGIENQPISISAAIGLGAVDARVFAIGLGNEFQVNTGALNAVSGSSGGNLLLSGVLTAGTDDFFRVKKFFLQILAGVTNTSIVRDPTGYINAGTRIRVPFDLSEADIDGRLILLTDVPVVRLSIEMPDGTVIDEGNAGAAGVTFVTDGTTKTSSFLLPVQFQGVSAQPGTWQAILDVDRARYKRTLSSLRDKDPTAAANLESKGARYCLSVHSFSNLRMKASVTQGSYDPGATLTLRAGLTEYNLPVEKRAEVRAELEYPDLTHGVLSLPEIQPGIFESTMVANAPGIYRFTVVASGATYRGTPFNREQALNAAVYHEIHGQRQDGWSRADLCRLLTCVLDDGTIGDRFTESLRKQGINLDGLRKCLEVYCADRG